MSTDYKKDCIQKTLEYLNQLNYDKLPDGDDLDHQLDFLLGEIYRQYSTFHWSGDQDDAVYSCHRRMIQEALDWPLEKLEPLLMEYNEDKTKRVVTKRLYYPAAGPKQNIVEPNLLVPGYRIICDDDGECIVTKSNGGESIEVWCVQDDQLHLGVVFLKDIIEVRGFDNRLIWSRQNEK